jgi:hypothetical protein
VREELAVKNCFHCGDAIAPTEPWTYNDSQRVVCLDCVDTDDEMTGEAYAEWAEFNGVSGYGDLDHVPWRSEIYGNYLP